MASSVDSHKTMYYFVAYHIMLFALMNAVPVYAQGATELTTSNAPRKVTRSESGAQEVNPRLSIVEKSFQYNLYESEDRLAKEAANRFDYRTQPQKDGSIIALHNAERPKECNGALRALRYRVVMNKYEPLQEFCWSRDKGAATITLTDPKAFIFKTQRIDASSLIYIKSEIDLRREEASRKAYEATQPAKNTNRSGINCIIVSPIITCE